jgi:hypothetical protein
MAFIVADLSIELIENLRPLVPRIKLKKRKMIFVQTLRCTSCGYLESYALETRADG